MHVSCVSRVPENYEQFIHIFFCFCNSTGYGECLLDKPSGRIYDLSSQLPGSMYDVNKQCELMFGLGSQVCPYLVSEQHSHAPSILKSFWKVGLEKKSQKVGLEKKSQDFWFLKEVYPEICQSSGSILGKGKEFSREHCSSIH